jgi:hypothetical protein
MRVNSRKPHEPENEKWEYLDVNVDLESRNNLGRSGWELVAVTQGQYGQFYHHFKRRLA